MSLFINIICFLGLLLIPGSHTLPITSPPSKAPAISPLRNPDYGPIVDQSSYYTSYSGKELAFPANMTTALPATEEGPPGPDDLLFQNLLGAEWVIYSFYQAGVENFNESSFTSLGAPNTTYGRIVEIRDNEAGHGRVFQEAISNTSVVPGRCNYDFGPLVTDPAAFLAASTILEISSMAFLTALLLEAKLPASKSSLMAIAQTESRHETWGLIDIWNVSPFAGPTDTVYPYANQILTTTAVFVAPASCPAINPPFPAPNQNLPLMSYKTESTTLLPGSPITFTFTDPTNQPKFKKGEKYFATYFHGLNSLSVEFNPANNNSVIPPEFESRGIILVVISDMPGAPTMESVIAGPVFIVEQPVIVNSVA
ncbi:MAG: hypothetical protein MMC33_010192 [Icmadophila ericetorum]|nr:hypothetical protein [Icmadophila ericetorum]